MTLMCKKEIEEFCLKHPLYSADKKIVIGKGVIPCEVLFVGEAPGKEENKVGKPFVGKSGKILDSWIRKANLQGKCAVINAVFLMPLDENGKIRKPTQEEIEDFRPWVKRLILEIAPKKIILVGSTACESLLNKSIGECLNKKHFIDGIPTYCIRHPAYYLRKGEDGIKDFEALISFSDSAISSPQKMEMKEGEIKLVGNRLYVKRNNFNDRVFIFEEEVNSNDFSEVYFVDTSNTVYAKIHRKDLDKILPQMYYKAGKVAKFVPITMMESLIEEEYEEFPKVNIQNAKNTATRKMLSEKLGAVCELFSMAGKEFKDIDSNERFWLDGKRFRVVYRDKKGDVDFLVGPEDEPEFETTNWLLAYKDANHYEFVGWITKSEVMETPARDHYGNGVMVRAVQQTKFRPITEIIRVKKIRSQTAEIKPQGYVPLHLHTEYSIGDGYGKPDEIAEALYMKGFYACAITDHGNLMSSWYMQKALLSKNIKPILGMEAYVADEDNPNTYYHITILVQNHKGWLNLLEINRKSVVENFYYKPRTTLDDLHKHKEGLIFLTGCPGAKHIKLFSQGKVQEAEKQLNRLKELFGSQLYAEIMPHYAVPGYKDACKFVIDWAKKSGVKIVVTPDSHYPEKSDKIYHTALRAIAMGRKIWEKENAYTGDTYHYLTEKEILDIFREHWGIDVKEYLENTIEVANLCNFTIEKIRDIENLPIMHENPDKRLEELVWEGLKSYTDTPTEEQLKRIELELGRIKEKGFSNYMLMIHDIVHSAKKQGIAYGPGRGSIGGSFVAQLIGIHSCDSIKYDLIFDRFLSVIRKDAPDVDLDFQDTRREDVVNYIERRFGKEHVCKIITFSKFHAKGVIRDVGRIFDLPRDEVDRVARLVVHRSGGDARADYTALDTFAEFEQAKIFKNKYPEAVDIMIHLEGRIRHLGVHAAGIIISKKKLVELCPIYRVNDEICVAWEKKACEEFGLVKVDVLGLSTLDVIEKTKELVKITKGIEIQLPVRDLDDAAVYEKIISQGRTTGCFQIETVGFQKFLRMLRCSNFQQLCDANALMRPGPLHVGAANQYVLRAQGKEKIKFHNDIVRRVTESTLGLILYQEQVMTVMHDVGGLSWATAEMIRKAISKSQGKKVFDELREQFQKNAWEVNRIPPEISKQIFDEVQLFGSYGFNRAHAVAYSILGYQTAWLKTYYPVEFLTACLIKEKNPAMEARLVADARDFGISVLPPDVNKSKATYYTDGINIYCGLSNIKGLPDKVAETICSRAPYRDIYDFFNKTKVSKPVFESLVYAGALDQLIPSRKWAIDNYEKIRKGVSPKNTLSVYLGENIEGNNDTEEFDEKTLVLKQLEFLNFPAEKHPIEMYEDPFCGKIKYEKIRDLEFEDYVDERWIKGIATFINFKQEGLEGSWTMFDNVLERKYAHVNLNDDSGGNVLVHFSPEQYTAYKKYFERGVGIPMIVKGSSIPRFQKIYADALIVMDDVDYSHPIFKWVQNRREDEIAKIKDLYPGRKVNSKGILCDVKVGVICSVRYKVSKGKKPYAMIHFYGEDRYAKHMVFKLDNKIFVAGEILVYLQERDSPFIEVIGRY